MEVAQEVARGVGGAASGAQAPTRDDIRGIGVVGVGCACAASRAGRQEPFAAAAHENLEVRLAGRLVEVEVADTRACAAALGVAAEGSWCGVKHIRSRDDAERFALGACEEFADQLHAGVVTVVGGVIREDALLVVVSLVACGVAGGTGGAVRHNRVQRGGGYDTCHRELIHRERGVGFSEINPVFHDAGSCAVCITHAVADHDDDIFRLEADWWS